VGCRAGGAGGDEHHGLVSEAFGGFLAAYAVWWPGAGGAGLSRILTLEKMDNHPHFPQISYWKNLWEMRVVVATASFCCGVGSSDLGNGHSRLGIR
jgi:hypothetical protein